MLHDQPQSPLLERYVSPEMARIFSPSHRYQHWRKLWIALAECQSELGLPISPQQLDQLRQVASEIDYQRVRELERDTRHDVVAHLRHFSEQAGDAGAILHLGATSAFITDNTDAVVVREALELVARRLLTLIRALATFARRNRALATLAYTHLQPAQLTTVGKRACLWAQDFVTDLTEVRHRHDAWRCRGVKGTTGTQASFLTLFESDHDKVLRLDRAVARALGFAATFPITGQTYPRKQDSQVLHTLAGVAESCHKLGTDLRLLQGLGELSEPFDDTQVGSSAMAYKRNPVRAERLCGLARRLLTDSLNGPLTASVQWLERSLDDSSNRRLVLPDAFLVADAILLLAANIAAGLRVHEAKIRSRVAQQIPFMATETLLMEAVVRGGHRQELHERLRRYSLEAQEVLEQGGDNPLVGRIAADPDFGLSKGEIESRLRPEHFIGRSAEQVDDFLDQVVEPLLSCHEPEQVEDPRV